MVLWSTRIFPPYPSAAFDHLAEQFAQLGDAATRRLYSVTLAVTNRCPFNCWHCYNAGRSQVDVPLAVLKNLAGELQALGTVMLTVTGGRTAGPGGSGGHRASIRPAVLPDSGHNRRGPDSGARPASAGERPSLPSASASTLIKRGEHDWRRGRKGAFRTALQALQVARESGLYPYVVSVATRGFLQRSRFLPFLRCAAAAGALEVHLLEPSATGRLAGQTDVLLTAAERKQIFDYQDEIAQDDDLPILSSFAYLESAEAFGCGAGLTHLYIDGSGEVCPCNLVPLSFGNLTQEPFRGILDRMGHHFCRPRTGCVGRMLARQFPSVGLPAPPERSRAICERHLPLTHALPAFFRIRDEAQEEVGAPNCGRLMTASTRITMRSGSWKRPSPSMTSSRACVGAAAKPSLRRVMGPGMPRPCSRPGQPACWRSISRPKCWPKRKSESACKTSTMFVSWPAMLWRHSRLRVRLIAFFRAGFWGISR